jgi:hypothetical protein
MIDRSHLNSGFLVEEQHLAEAALVAAEGHLPPATSGTFVQFVVSRKEAKLRQRERETFAPL